MRYKILFFLLCALCIKVKATHVIGGTMTYECLGNNTYRVSFTMLRDCINGVAQFDAPAAVGIFDNNGNLLTKVGNKGIVYLYYTKQSLPLDRSLIKDACILPPSPTDCIEEAKYTADIVLPVRAGGYNLIYQRCCRNKVIQNIVEPLFTGASWNVLLPETALKTCNSSPLFKKWSPTLLCAGKGYNFDHSAIDTDSDSLVYSLWTPQRFNQESLIPIPIPPNNQSSDITWIPNVYNQNNQLGGTTNPFSIDPRTGMISAIPQILGHFLLGIKVQEFRNGQLLSTVYRDWEVSVSNCADFTSENADYFTICPGDTNNLPFLLNDSDSAKYKYSWKDNPLIIGASTTARPIITFNTPGTYTLYATIDSRMGCILDDSIKVHVLNKGKLDFSYSLVGNEVSFTNNSLDVKSFKWDFGVSNTNDDTSTSENPKFKYTDPGKYNITIWSDDQCTIPIVKQILVNFELSDSIPACVNSTININKRPNPSYKYDWSPAHLLSDPNSSNPTTIVNTVIPTLFVSPLIDSITGEVVGNQKVLVSPITIPGLTINEYTICEGDTVQINNIIPDSLRTRYDYIWETNSIIIKDQNTDHPTITSPTENELLLYVVRTDKTSGCIFRDSLLIKLKRKPVLDFDMVQTAAPFTVKFNALADSSISNFKWDFGVTGVDSDTSINRNPTFVYPAPGNYPITLSTIDECDNEITKTINVLLPDPFEIRDTLIVCKNELINLNTRLGSAYRYEWSPADKVNMATAINPVFTADSSRVFTATLFDTSLNFHAGTLIVYVIVPIINTILKDTIPVCGLSQQELNRGGNTSVTYEWTPSTGLNNPFSANPIASVINQTKYFVKITDTISKCQVYDSILVLPYLADINRLTQDSISTCRNTPVALNPNGLQDTNLIYKWSPGILLNDSTLYNPIAKVNSTTIFIMQVTDKRLVECTVSKLIQLMVIAVPALDSVSLPDSVQVCSGVSTAINPNANHRLKYIWAPAQFFDQPNSPNPNILVRNTLVVSVRISDPNNPLCDTVRQIKIIPSSINVSATFRDSITCNDNPVLLSAMSDKSKVRFEWFDGNQSIAKSDTVQIIPSVRKMYKVVGTDSLGCMNMDTVSIASAKITSDASSVSPQGICPGQSTKLNVQTTGLSSGLIYNWGPATAILSGSNTSNPEVKPLTSTLFTVTVTNANGCMSMDTVTVKVHPVTSVTAAAVPPTIRWGQSSQITSTNIPGYSYRWSPTDLSNSTISNPVAKPTKTTIYTATVTSPDGCVQNVQVTITVLEPECAEPYIFLPNAFTPNGDGKNDILYLRANNITNMSLMIYNRWGQKVFESRSQNDGWDGTFKGKKLYPDAFGYYLSVDCGNGQKFQKKGNVTILR